MRVCPNCGRKDYPWKHRLHNLYTDYCHIGKLLVFDEQLAKNIQNSPKFYTDRLFNYRMKPDGFVFRIWREDARLPSSLMEPPQEAKTRLLRAAPKQNKLTVFNGEDTV